ncbi:TIGR00730 family Rossman fold protein [Niveibacterium terrae]|uniref:LOG family protein n=1 Tax=Niveibacterium terrae TaxID=3373598 RepID=UPI003A94C6DD
MAIRSLCVYCGSRSGARPEYLEQAKRLGREMAARGIALVYGGASVGLMGAVADSVLDAGGRAIGIIPQSLARKEIAHHGLTELNVVDSMHSRKSLMAEKADAFVALPGGIGTFEEMFEMWTWAQLGFHAKPIGLLDTAGYYTGLIAFLDRATREDFMAPATRALLQVADEPSVLLDRLAAFTAPSAERWVGAGQT